MDAEVSYRVRVGPGERERAERLSAVLTWQPMGLSAVLGAVRGSDLQPTGWALCAVLIVIPSSVASGDAEVSSRSSFLLSF